MSILEFRKLDSLVESQVSVSMSLNDLRLMVNSMRALEYFSEVDDEPYLDADGLALKDRLERQYSALAANRSAGGF